MEETKCLKPSGSGSRIGDRASVQAATRVNAEQASKRTMCRPTRQPFRGRLTRMGEFRARTTPICCTGVVAAACTQGKRTQHGKPHCVIRDDQPDAREGQAGRSGVAERPVVPLKPGNAGGGKGPWFKTNAASGEGPEIGKPSNSETCSETADGVTRESEDRSRLSLLRPLRQDQPRGYSCARLRSVSLQQGRSGSGRPGFCGHRDVWGRAMAGRPGACAQGRDLPPG